MWRRTECLGLPQDKQSELSLQNTHGGREVLNPPFCSLTSTHKSRFYPWNSYGRREPIPTNCPLTSIWTPWHTLKIKCSIFLKTCLCSNVLLLINASQRKQLTGESASPRSLEKNENSYHLLSQGVGDSGVHTILLQMAAVLEWQRDTMTRDLGHPLLVFICKSLVCVKLTKLFFIIDPSSTWHLSTVKPQPILSCSSPRWHTDINIIIIF